MKRRKLSQVIAVTLAVCMLAGCVLTGCGSKSDNANKETTQSGSTLIYGSNDYTRINPAIDEHGEINLLLFDGLTAHDENNEVVPGLAESWELDDATNTYTFHLRDDVGMMERNLQQMMLSLRSKQSWIRTMNQRLLLIMRMLQQSM